MKNGLDEQYIDLLKDILENGVEKDTRNGKVLSVFGRTIRYKFNDGKFPLLTTKKMHFEGIIAELIWFLRGDTNIRYLVDNGCHIWDGDAYKNHCNAHPDAEKTFQYEGSDIEVRRMNQEEFINRIKTDDEFAKKWGDLGPIYGKQWRQWADYYNGSVEYIDQFSDLIKKLKTTPDDRRMMVTAWNPSEIEAAVLPPCHYGFQVYTRELSEQERWELYCETCNRLQTPWIKGSTDQETMDRYYTEYNIPKRAISLLWNQRSCDTPLGIPYNIASYGLLLIILGKIVNMVPEELIGNLGDTHIYENQIEKLKEQFGRELTHIERIEKLFETNKDAKSLLSQEEPKVISSLLLDELKVPTRTREPYPLPSISFSENFETLVRKFNGSTEGTGSPDFGYANNIDNVINALSPSDFTLQNYQSHPAINIPLSN